MDQQPSSDQTTIPTIPSVTTTDSKAPTGKSSSMNGCEIQQHATTDISKASTVEQKYDVPLPSSNSMVSSVQSATTITVARNESIKQHSTVANTKALATNSVATVHSSETVVAVPNESLPPKMHPVQREPISNVDTAQKPPPPPHAQPAAAAEPSALPLPPKSSSNNNHPSMPLHHLPYHHPYYYPPPYYYGYHPPYGYLYPHQYHYESSNDSIDGKTSDESNHDRATSNGVTTANEKPPHLSTANAAPTTLPNTAPDSRVVSNETNNAASTATKPIASQIPPVIPIGIPPGASKTAAASGSNDGDNHPQPTNKLPLKPSSISDIPAPRMKSNVQLPSNTPVAASSDTVPKPRSEPPEIHPPRRASIHHHHQQQSQPPSQNPTPVVTQQQQKHHNDELLTRTPIKSNTTSARTGLNIPLDNTKAAFTTARNAPLATNSGQANPISTKNSTVFVPTAVPSTEKSPVLCTVSKPVVMVDQLTYDWSSLQLDGTRAWNQLLEQRHNLSQTNVDGETNEQPSVTALHTYQLMQNLKETLHDTIILPPPDSPLHLIHEARQHDDAAHNSFRDEELIRAPERCPEELLPIYTNAAIIYGKRIAEQRNFRQRQQYQQQQYQGDPQQKQQANQPSLKDKYQLMTANELCQYVQETKKEISSLYRKEQRVLNTAKRLFLYPPPNKEQPPSMNHKGMYNDDEIRQRYNDHFRKPDQLPPATATTSSSRTTNGIGAVPKGQKRLWQDDDISTLFKKR
jgi:hypothetical protein